MQRLALIIIVFGMLAAAFVGTKAAHAQDAPSLTPDQIDHIRQHCVTAQTTIKRIHTNDVLLRNNRGKLYELISTKLMGPLNSRIALDRQEGLKLAATTIEYDRQRDVFSDNYKQYDEAITRVSNTNCSEKPVEFYSNLQTAREYRQRVHQDTEALTALLEAYRVEFENFADKFEEGR
jgi:hypothetical protein